MQMGPMQLLLIAIVVLVLFGRGKIASMMGEVGKGITAFKKGMTDGSAEAENAALEEAKDITPVEPEPAKKAPARKAPAKKV